MTDPWDLWYPGGIHDPAPTSVWGEYTDVGEPKFVIHTTEGGLGAYTPDPRTGDGRRYYGATGTWPNYTLAIDPTRVWRVYNHIPAGRASLSLRNRAGGVETNRDNATQVEIATKASAIGELPGEALDELARLLAWEHRARGVPLESAVTWVAYPASYGERAPQRLSPPAWDAYAGVCGHQHVPENDHGDPGAFPIGALLARALAIVRGDDVTEQDKIDIANKVLAALRYQVFSVSPPIRQGSAGQVIGATYNKVGDLQAVLAGGAGSVISRLDRTETMVSWLIGIITGAAQTPAPRRSYADAADVLLRHVPDPADLDELATTARERAAELRAAAEAGP